MTMKRIKSIRSGIRLPAVLLTLLATVHVALGWYDPSLGRWIQRDPIGAGDINLYRFVQNDPENRVDPFGFNSLTFPMPDGTTLWFGPYPKTPPGMKFHLWWANQDSKPPGWIWVQDANGTFRPSPDDLKGLEPSLLGDMMLGGVGGGLRGGSFRVCPAAESRAARLFPDYMRFRGQGFTPAQAKYLAEPYRGMGHHFIPRRAPLPQRTTEHPANIMGRGMSRGAFYERHFFGDPYFHGTAFPKGIGGTWSGDAIGLVKPMPPINLWYAAPNWLRVGASVGAAGGGAGAIYYFSGDE
jgi:hypothetical protein